MSRDEQIRQALSQRWRQGRKVPRNIYAVTGDDPDKDVDIGRMDSAFIASEVVEAHNAMLAATFEHIGAG